MDSFYNEKGGCQGGQEAGKPNFPRGLDSKTFLVSVWDPEKTLPPEMRRAWWLVPACFYWKMCSESITAPRRSCCRPGSEIVVPQLQGYEAGVPTGRWLVGRVQVGVSGWGKPSFLPSVGSQSCPAFPPSTSGSIPAAIIIPNGICSL